MKITTNQNMSAKEWLDKNEWENKPIESTAFSHYTMLDTLMEEYAKCYLIEHINYLKQKTKVEQKKYI